MKVKGNLLTIKSYITFISESLIYKQKHKANIIVLASYNK